MYIEIGVEPLNAGFLVGDSTHLIATAYGRLLLLKLCLLWSGGQTPGLGHYEQGTTRHTIRANGFKLISVL